MTLLKLSWWGRILAAHNTEPTEVFGALVLYVFGGWLVLPLETFTSSPSFAAMAVVPEWAWGVALIVLGSAQLMALRDGHRPWRRSVALAGFLVWCTVGITLLLANPLATGGAVYLLIAASQGWVHIRLGYPA